MADPEQGEGHGLYTIEQRRVEQDRQGRPSQVVIDRPAGRIGGRVGRHQVLDEDAVQGMARRVLPPEIAVGRGGQQQRQAATASTTKTPVADSRSRMVSLLRSSAKTGADRERHAMLDSLPDAVSWLIPFPGYRREAFVRRVGRGRGSDDPLGPQSGDRGLVVADLGQYGRRYPPRVRGPAYRAARRRVPSGSRSPSAASDHICCPPSASRHGPRFADGR